MLAAAGFMSVATDSVSNAAGFMSVASNFVSNAAGFMSVANGSVSDAADVMSPYYMRQRLALSPADKLALQRVLPA